jgi:phospholipid/cholesterol/gamma-HCH transport system substrate-binding protein
MDKKIANNVIVGTMFLFGFIAFVFVLFNIGGGGFFRSQLTLFGKFTQVKGLHMGSEVSLSGLRVGVIKGLQITDPKTREITVEMSVSRNVQQYLRRDSVATVKTQGILGDRYIELSIGSFDEPMLEEGAFVVASEPEDIFQKGGKVVDGVANKFGPGGDVETLLKRLNIIADNLVSLTAQLKAGKSGEKISGAVAHMEEILRKVRAGEGSLGALINDPTVYEDIKAMTGGAKRSAVLQYFMRQFIDEGAKDLKPSQSPREPSAK